MEKLKDKVLAKKNWKPSAPIQKLGIDLIFKAFKKVIRLVVKLSL